MQNSDDKNTPEPGPATVDKPASPSKNESQSGLDLAHRPKEVGGRQGPEPTRYGDWEKNGRCIDF